MANVTPIKSIPGSGNARTAGEMALGTDTLDPGFIGPANQNIQSAAYTCVLSDMGKQILHPFADNNARTFTIPNAVFPIGAELWFINRRNTVTISIVTEIMYLSPGGSTGNRTLAANGCAVAKKITATEWMIMGWGLT